MILNDLEKSINSMKELERRELLKRNDDKQKKTDQNYRELIILTHKLVDTVYYCKNNFEMPVENEVVDKFEALFEKLRKVIESGYANSDLCDSAKSDYNKLNNDIKKNWNSFYGDFTLPTIETLRVIIGFDKENITECIKKIRNVEKWTDDIKKFEILSEGLENATEIINSIGMDEEIKGFLNKMNNNKATINDLNPKVLKWIKNENFEDKIGLRFVGL